MDKTEIKYVDMGLGLKLSYIHLDRNSANFIVIFPQGQRTAEFALNKYFEILPEDFNIMAFDQPGTGNSDSFGLNSDPKTIAEYVLTALRKHGYKTERTILMGKSLSSSYPIACVSIDSSFHSLVIISGYKFLTRRMAMVCYPMIKYITGKFILRYMIDKTIKFLDHFSNFKKGYVDLSDSNRWITLSNLIKFRLEDNVVNIPIYILWHEHDELIPSTTRAEILHECKNAQTYIIPTRGHWNESPVEYDYLKDIFELIKQKMNT